MLSIGKVSPANIGYYTELAKDGYYEGTEPGEWIGSGAPLLGLSGRVNSADFAQLLAGFHPAHGARLVENAGWLHGARARRPGFDLCFSMPKSLSIWFFAASPELRERILDAHHRAAEASLARLEELASVARTGHGGVGQIRGTGLTFARFDHWLSRELEPAVHSHYVLANVIRGTDGRYRALDGRVLFRRGLKHKLGAQYRLELANSVLTELGVAIRNRPGKHSFWEIEGVGADLIAELSTRRRQIVEAGYSSGKEAAVVALSTRKGKERQLLSSGELFSAWHKQLVGRLPETLPLTCPEPKPAQSRKKAEQCDSEKAKTKPEVRRPNNVASLGREQNVIRRVISGIKALTPALPSAPIALLESLRFRGMSACERSRVLRIALGRGRTEIPRALTDQQLRALSSIHKKSSLRCYVVTSAARARALYRLGVRAWSGHVVVDRLLPRRGLAQALRFNLTGEVISDSNGRKRRHGGLRSAIYRPNKLAPLRRIVVNRPLFGWQFLDRKTLVVIEADNLLSEQVDAILAAARRHGARIVIAGTPRQTLAIDDHERLETRSTPPPTDNEPEVEAHPIVCHM
ncbi:MAG: relaxase domain-containing protein [bacterium]|nr:relaxase domain-containing protein [bacterium]